MAREPVRLDWRVPSEEWQHFRDYVESEFGGIEGYLGREAELAMKEYADADGYDDVEEKVDRLVEAAGRRPGEVAREKNNSLSGQPTTRVTARVDEDIKDEFRNVARDDDDPFGVVFARAIRQRRDGGRAARLERKLDRVVDDAESLLSELDGESGDKLDAVERRTITICSRLDEQFTDDVLIEEINDVVGDTDYAHNKYRDLVTARLGVEPHPHVGTDFADTNAEILWVPTEVAEDAVPEEMPRECRQPPEMLDRDDRIRRLRLAAGCRAANDTSGQSTVRRESVRKEILDGAVGADKTEELMNAAALVTGFSFDESVGSCALLCDLEEVREYEVELFNEIIRYRDCDVESMFDEYDASLGDYSEPETTESPSFAEGVADVDDSGSARTDGGGSSRDQDVEDGDVDD